jgi:hypothetical protein
VVRQQWLDLNALTGCSKRIKRLSYKVVTQARYEIYFTVTPPVND